MMSNLCKREKEPDGSWTCINDHTGCVYNNGHNECMEEGSSLSPLEQPEAILYMPIRALLKDYHNF